MANNYDDDCDDCDMVTHHTYLGHTAEYWQDMGTTIYLPWIFLIGMTILLTFILNRKARRRYRNALEMQKDAFERQKEAIGQQKEAINLQKEALQLLKEISQKLDR